MWIFTKDGFASIVADETNPEFLLARGRIRGDLEKLFHGCKVEVTPEKDYRFRTHVTREAVAARLAELAAVIDYPNFKNACDDDRHDAYLDVWTSMYREQMRRLPRRRQPKKSKPKYPIHGVCGFRHPAGALYCPGAY
jgi:hypothetical protein